MSYSVDVNILVHASNSGSPHHERAVRFIESRAIDPDLFCLTWATIHGYLRIVTHPSIFTQPLPPRTALANIEALLALPRVRVIGETDSHWEALRDAAGTAPLRGNLVPDVAFAAVLAQHGVQRLYTQDRDFRRFDFLTSIDPFAAELET